MTDTTARPDTVERPCRVSWCTRDIDKYPTSGLCNACWTWSKRHGDADPESSERRRLQPPPPDGRCTIVEEGQLCSGSHAARGMCKRHFLRFWRHGSAEKRRRSPGELLALVQAAAQATTDDCILVPCQHSRPSLRYRGQPTVAARAVWIEATGVDPGEGMVLHTCHRGDEGCINIRHLYLGDHARNTLDMVEAERSARGEDNGNAELTEADIREIRRLYRTRLVSQRGLAGQFRVSQGTIHQIVSYKTWKHISD